MIKNERVLRSNTVYVVTDELYVCQGQLTETQRNIIVKGRYKYVRLDLTDKHGNNLGKKRVAVSDVFSFKGEAFTEAVMRFNDRA